MELFVINRYTGEEAALQEIPNEEKLRKNLLKKIKERQRLSQSNNTVLEEIPQLKKRKSNTDECEGDLGENLPETVEEEIKKVKKKKKSKKELEDLIEDSKQNDSSDENKKPKICKKKKKEKLENDDDNQNEEEGKEENETETEQKLTGFTILGDLHMAKKEKVKRKLPNWLANPSVVSVDLKNLTCTVDSIPELDSIFVDKLKENRISHFFPVQSQIIPWLLKNANRPSMYWPNDICVSAPTGSGKTLAFVLPILQVLYKRVVPRIRALVVLPVQNLANQVFKVFETYSQPTDLKVLLLSKKRTFEEEQSLICRTDGTGNYRTMVDILVTTPGRLVEHLAKTKGLCLDDLRYLVIDEADRVMEKVQNNWLYHLNKLINTDCTRSYQVPAISLNIMRNKIRPPNKLLFSATLSQDPEKLQQLGLFQPKLFTSVVKSKKSKTDNDEGDKDETKFIGKYTTPAELTEYYATCTKANKPLIVHHLLKSKSWKNVLCFVNSVEATFRLAYVLKYLNKKKLKVGKLSANLTVRKRDLVLKKFSDGGIDVLVCSDALARGIDIPNVQYVISYDSPKFIKTYVHRIGRTGRAGKEGTSLVLLTSKEVKHFQKMIEVAGKNSVQELSINEEELKEYEESFENALSFLGQRIEKEKQLTLLKAKRNKKLQMQVFRGKISKSFKKVGKKFTYKKNKVKNKKVVELSVDKPDSENAKSIE